jgi:hypothetical protein
MGKHCMVQRFSALARKGYPRPAARTRQDQLRSPAQIRLDIAADHKRRFSKTDSEQKNRPAIMLVLYPLPTQV